MAWRSWLRRGRQGRHAVDTLGLAGTPPAGNGGRLCGCMGVWVFGCSRGRHLPPQASTTGALRLMLLLAGLAVSGCGRPSSPAGSPAVAAVGGDPFRDVT